MAEKKENVEFKITPEIQDALMRLAGQEQLIATQRQMLVERSLRLAGISDAIVRVELSPDLSTFILMDVEVTK